jgi:membrane complex biogenesis BtpA family protein
MQSLNIKNKPLVGVIYLQPLSGREKHLGCSQSIEAALQDASALVNAGFTLALFENENDRPYSLLASQPHRTEMIDIGNAIKMEFPQLQLGVEFLLNDPKASLDIAHAMNGSFIRTDYFSDRMQRCESKQEMEIAPHAVVAHRDSKKEPIHIWADVQVKHATPLEEISLRHAAKRAVAFGADGVIVTGSWTGIPPTPDDIREAQKGAQGQPVIIGSGFSTDYIKSLWPVCDGALVGTSIMTQGRINADKAARLIDAIAELV